jgi:hypothetical protein
MVTTGSKILKTSECIKTDFLGKAYFQVITGSQKQKAPKGAHANGGDLLRGW